MAVEKFIQPKEPEHPSHIGQHSHVRRLEEAINKLRTFRQESTPQQRMEDQIPTDQEIILFPQFSQSAPSEQIDL